MKHLICIFLLFCIPFLSGCKPAVSSQIEYEKTFEDKKDDNYELNVLSKSDLAQYHSFLLLTGGLLFGSICFYSYKRKRGDAEIVKLNAENQTLHTGMESLQKDLLQKEMEIDGLQKQHCEQQKKDMGQKEQLNDCYQELLEQFRQKLETQEKQLNEKDEEILRLKSLHLKSAMNLYPMYGKLLELLDYNKRHPDGMKTFSSEEWSILLQEIDDASRGFVERLQKQYECLSENNIRFCCLVRLEFSYPDISHIWGNSTVAGSTYKRESAILNKMGVSSTKEVTLLDILNRI